MSRDDNKGCIITKDNRILSQKQAKVLYYNDFDLSKVSQMLYKEVSNIIGDFLSRNRDIEHMSSLSIDDFEDWECPISPWGSDV